MQAPAALRAGLAVASGAYAASLARRSPKRRATDAIIGSSDSMMIRLNKMLEYFTMSRRARRLAFKRRRSCELRRIAFVDLGEGACGVSRRGSMLSEELRAATAL